MRNRKHRTDASGATGEVDKRRRREGRGWGPFSGTQLTIVVVAVSLALIPSAVGAAVGAFTSSTTTAAVTGTNSSATAGAKGVYGHTTGTGNTARTGVLGTANGSQGIGVKGTGSLYGVYSSGPFAATGNATIGGGANIANGASIGGTTTMFNALIAGTLSIASPNTLSCSACVTSADLAVGAVSSGSLANGSVTATKLAAGSVGPTALSAAAKAEQPLASGESESGTFVTGDSYSNVVPAGSGILWASLNFVRPVPGPLTGDVIKVPTYDAHCTGEGSAAPGYLCVYDSQDHDVSSPGAGPLGFYPVNGGFAGWTEPGSAGLASASGTFTVTAP